MLINCAAYENGTKLADVPVERISDYLQRPGCFVWVALRDASDAEIEQMRGEFGLHELAVEDVAAAARTLIDSLVTTAEPRDRAIEAARAKARSLARFGA